MQKSSKTTTHKEIDLEFNLVFKKYVIILMKV